MYETTTVTINLVRSDDNFASLRIPCTFGNKPGESEHIRTMLHADLYSTSLPLAAVLFGAGNIMHVMRDSATVYPSPWGKYISQHRLYKTPDDDILCPEFYVPKAGSVEEAKKSLEAYMADFGAECVEKGFFAESEEAAKETFGELFYKEFAVTTEPDAKVVYVPNPIYLNEAMTIYKGKMA